jgi:hypothetical protein
MTSIEKSPTTGPRVPKRPEVIQPPLPSFLRVREPKPAAAGPVFPKETRPWGPPSARRDRAI